MTDASNRLDADGLSSRSSQLPGPELPQPGGHPPIGAASLSDRFRCAAARGDRSVSGEQRPGDHGGYAKATPIGSRPASDHVEQATHDALAIGPQAVVGVLVGNPGPQATNATGRLLGK